MHIHVVPILNDNYAYIIQSDTEVAVVDPGEAAPIIDFLNDHGLHPDWIINTHKHGDHINGNVQLMDAFDCKLAAPAECEGNKDYVLEDGDLFPVGNLGFQISLTKGHTGGHIVLYEPHHNILFSGDTLFAMGCGRLFEGESHDMFQAMKYIKSLPAQTKIYCGHEYTRANADFARHILPDNAEISRRHKEVQSVDCTMPTTVAQELKTNPFLIARDVSEFAKYRQAKDNF